MQLFLYAKQRNLSYFALNTSALTEPTGSVYTEYKGLPMQLSLVPISGGNTGYNYSYYASIEMELQKPFRLTIGPSGPIMQGINFALRQVDKAVDAVKGEQNLIPDYGFPDVYKGRHISTDNRAFAKLVLQDLELRNILCARKTFEVRIAPSEYNQCHHTVSVCALQSHIENPTLDEATEREVGTSKELRLKATQAAFARRLDDLILSAWAARAAAMQWKMDS